MDNNKHVSTRSVGVRDNCGIGNIIVPRGVDRNKYITKCKRTNTVTLLLENGGICDNVLIDRTVLTNIDFPSDYKQLGSQVVWINRSKKNEPIVVGIIAKTNELTNNTGSGNSLRSVSSGTIAEVLVDGEKGTVIVNCSSSSDSGGDIYIISTNKKKTSKMNVRVSGSIDVQTPYCKITNTDKFEINIADESKDNNITTIVYQKGEGLNYQDEFGNKIVVNKDAIGITPIGKLNVGEGKEAMVLGNTLKAEIEKTNNLLQSLINIINGPQIVEAGNGAPSSLQIALQAAIVTQTLGDFSKVLSDLSNTD